MTELELAVNEVDGKIQIIATKGTNFFQITAIPRWKSLYVFSVRGRGAAPLFRPVYSKFLELAKKRGYRKITADVVANEKLLKLAKIAGFKKSRLRNFFGISHGLKGVVGMSTVPMHKRIQHR